MRRWLIALAALLVGLPLAALALAFGYAWLSLPQTSGTLRLAGLDANVEIVRDGHGVPHVFARGERDAWFALGVLHVQDRAVQMEMTRRAGAGRLAEAIGPAGLDLDRLTRTLDLSGNAARSLAALPGEARATIDAYVAGVNAAQAGLGWPRPPEFLWLGEPEPWQPEDVLLWAQLMALQLSGNWRQELARVRLADRATPAMLAELWPEWPADSGTTLAEAASLLRGLDLGRLAALPVLGPETASNHWVVSGARSDTGLPYLVNDPHLGLGGPGTWYLVRIVLPDRALTGVTAPGSPGLILGQNGFIAWGLTTTTADVSDLFIEQVDPADPTRYRAGEGWEPFRVRTETIRVRDRPDEVLTVRSTRNGVVISDLAGAPDAFTAIALARTADLGPDRTPAAIFALNRARDRAEFLAAVELWHAPVQNVVYADRAGHIGFAVAGAVPRRRVGQGWVPVRGWVDANRWDGLVPRAELPRAFDPPSGRIANANNRIASNGPFLSRDWDAPFRGRRIAERLDAEPHHDAAGMAELLADPVSLFAREMLARLRVPAPGARDAAALRLLGAWDGAMRRDRPEPLIFAAWMRELTLDLLEGAFGTPGRELARELPALLLAAAEGRSAFCARDGARSCERLAAAALVRALTALGARHGEDMARWRWGDEHFAPFANPLYQRIPVLRDLFGFRVPTDGDYYTVNRGASFIGSPQPFAHVHGAGYRAIYDLADPDRSLFVVAPGQSGHPLSRHWGDLARTWADGRHLPVAGTRESLAPFPLLRLEPVGR